MMQQRNIWSSTLVVVLVSVIAWLARQNEWLTDARLMLHEVVRPTRAVVLSIWPREGPAVRNAVADPNDPGLLQDQLLDNEIQRRQLLIRNARLRHELQRARQQLASVTTVTAPDLVNFVGLQAQVLSHDGLPRSLRDLVIDHGQASGLRTSQLVLEGSGLLLDKGTNFRLEEGLKVASGIAVVGRIVKVAQWVSLVQPVTDQEFSAAVQLVKTSEDGESLGARGLLQGNGDGQCVITGIPYTDAVAVGDEVFSADVAGIAGPRLYYGRVVTADFTTGGQWHVVVAPALGTSVPDCVTVLKPKLSFRTTANDRTVR